MRRILILVLVSSLLGLLAGPAESDTPGSVYERDRYDDPYAFTDRECGFPIKVSGRRWGRSVTRNVPGSDGQAFLLDDRYHYRETLTNPRNGKRMYISGDGRVTERKATHVEGNIWEFRVVDRGRPFVIKNARRQTVLADHGQVVFKAVFDTLGDGKPGGEQISFELVTTAWGDFPSLEPDFDFCAVARRLIG